MPLDDTEARWITLFTAGAVKLPDKLAQEDAQNPIADLEQKLKLAQLEESTRAQALKEAMLATAVAAVDKDKDNLAKATKFEVTRKTKEGKTVTEQTIAKGGQVKSFEASDTQGITQIGGKDIHDTDAQAELHKLRNTCLETLSKQKNDLLAMTFPRSYIDTKAKQIKVKDEPLFDPKEVMNELYTPLVRELVLPDTLIEDKFSATQQMIDGSNEYYIKECKEKGKSIATGKLALVKGTITLAGSVANIITGSLAPVNTDPTKPPVVPLDHSGALSSFDSGRAKEITDGIVAGLTGMLDIADTIHDQYVGGDFPETKFKTALTLLGNSLGKIIAGFMPNGSEGVGLTVAAAIGGATSASAFSVQLVKWAKAPKGTQFPWEGLCGAIGDSVGSVFNSLSNNESDTDKADKYANAASLVPTVMGALGSAAKARVLPAIMKGDWDTLFDWIVDTSGGLGKALPAVLQFNHQYDAIPGATSTDPQDKQNEEAQKQYGKQAKLLSALDTMNTGVDKTSGGVAAMKNTKLVLEFLDSLPTPKSKKLDEEVQKKFDEQQKKAIKEKEEADKKDVENIEKRLAQELADYQEALNCLGSKNPTDAEYKSIAKLIAQIEHDQKIWDGLIAIFGGGIGTASGVGAALSVASEVAAPLKIAGQLVKYVANIKAAADRMIAVMNWREAQKDAVSATSPYATSIQNFLDNQTKQRNHYYIQAASNAIQALLAAGEMSPMAPAFKIAGSSVAAGAALEDLIYQYKKQSALREAWKFTQVALQPENKSNRRMHLKVREMNPTLAKYTVAYGALIVKDPIAITACNRVGLDRETLARAKDKVSDVKKYLETLYKEDGTVVGMLEVKGKGKVKMPKAELSAKSWVLTVAVLKKDAGMATEAPPSVAACLMTAEKLGKLDVEMAGIVDLDNPEARYTKEQETYTRKKVKEALDLCNALNRMADDLDAFKPLTKGGLPCEGAIAAAKEFAALADARLSAMRSEWAPFFARTQGQG